MILTAITFLIIAGCKNSTDPEDMLVLSDSFEVNHVGSYSGWHIDPARADFSDDAPDGGGSWSLSLTPGNTSEGYAIKYLEPNHGDGIYRMSIWVKRYGTGTNYASVKFGKMEADSTLTLKEEIPAPDSACRNVIITDTLAFESGDRIYIKLSAGTSEVDTWQSLFDLVRMEKLAD
jgi:hypothetical protein